MGKHSDVINTYVRHNAPASEPPTIMQVTYAKEVSDFLGLGTELDALEYTKIAYTQFLNKYVRLYKDKKNRR